MRDVLVMFFMLGGLFFFIVGTLGILRFPDALTRAHGAAKCDTLGAALCLVGLMIYSGLNTASLKLLLVIVFVWVTNPTATHAIARGILKARRNTKGGAESH
ncbi:monovalent cation/H(+) antiporter subunit G [Acidaminobacter hydrogenoformans]|uniref:Multisubunit sodium/proton antiporter, MrpG subunit n=1 Tax=Acidaminobacter hydrogenoformans DSM 2784 TaxID=1120920 RepID=A0A1G5RWD2_9FIRM|nr:monovalent cation/H(+) antiporter subunit G [Acidaminobacter hydrogenoformans]SCZ77619.1 multisubunit sodium/proton antiporter, MrpG subunit [Acidaminobacter hydrogenoformans DSM 2784]